MRYTGLSGKTYELGSTPFSSGGEGEIYEIVKVSDKCAKVYHQGLRSKELEEKLKVMVANPPDQSVLFQIAWPLDIIYSNVKDFVGFIMPKIDVSGELQPVYKYPPKEYKGLTFKQKLIIAQNICAAIEVLHTAGVVLGDFSPCNIGVDMNTGHVAFWDTGSYHIKDRKTGRTYRCKVCFDGYVAPELLLKCKGINPQTGKSYTYEDAPLETFTKETDNFALAIHIFKLIMNGFTPFFGIDINSNESISTRAPGVGSIAVEKDMYCFKPGYVHMSKAVADKNTLPTEIVGLFDRAFINGRIDPKQRPTAREWHNALEHFINKLQQCKVNPTHQYMKGLHTCPWCEIDKKFNNNIQAAVSQQQNIPGIAPAPRQVAVLTNRTASINGGQQSKNKKNTLRAEIVVLIICVASVLLFYFADSARWRKNTQPELGYGISDTVQAWSPYTKISFTGSLDNAADNDRYTVTLKSDYHPSYGNREYKVEFKAVTSSSDGIRVLISNEEGQSTSFRSNDEDTYDDVHTVILTAGQTYTISVYSNSGETDYYLGMGND